MVKRTRRRVLAGLGGLVAVLTLVVAGAAIGAQGYNGPARQVYQGGNPTCPAGLADAGSTSISNTDLQAGYTDGRISITRRGVVNGIDSFDWVIADHSVDVMAVIVKGGDGAYIYFYDSLGGSWRDNDLAPPLNDGGQAPQISHAVFCYDPKDAPNPVLSVEKSASGSSEITHSWEVDKQVKPAGAADSAYGDNTVAQPARRRQRLRHLEGDGDALAGADATPCTGTITRQERRRRSPSPASTSPISIPGARRSTAAATAARASPCRQRARSPAATRVTPDSEVPNNTATVTWGRSQLEDRHGDDRVGRSDRGRHPRARRRRRQRGRDARRGRPHEQRMDDDLQRAVDVRERQAVAEQRPHEHGGRHVGRRVGLGQRERSGRLRQDAAASSAAASASADGNESMDLQIVKDATQQVQLVNGQADIAYSVAGAEQRPEPGAQRRGLGRGAGRRHVPRGHDAACRRHVHGHRRRCSTAASARSAPASIRTIGVSARVTQTGTYDNCATVAGDGGDTNPANNRDCAETRRHDSAGGTLDAAGHAARQAEAEAGSRSRSRRRTCAACSRSTPSW